MNKSGKRQNKMFLGMKKIKKVANYIVNGKDIIIYLIDINASDILYKLLNIFLNRSVILVKR